MFNPNFYMAPPGPMGSGPVAPQPQMYPPPQYPMFSPLQLVHGVMNFMGQPQIQPQMQPQMKP